MNGPVGRLRAVESHVRGGGAPPAPPPLRAAPVSGAPPLEALQAAISKKFDDAKMKQFLSQGYMVVPVDDLDRDFHETIYTKAKTLYRAEDGGGVDFGNNVFPAVPDLGAVYQAPAVVGAISSVLGENYVMHPHRHLHSTSLGTRNDQNFHMDSYWGMTRTRHHAPRWVMALYYPHDVVLESGPTGIVPFSQYYEMPDQREGVGPAHSSEDFGERDAAIDETVKSLDPAFNGLPVCVPGGSVVMMAYDVYHRGCRRRDDVADWRAMLKFQFVATGSRFEPSWNHDPSDDGAFAVPEMMDGRHSVVWDSMLDFCSNRIDDALVTPLPADLPQTAAEACAMMHSGAMEADRMGAAYTLARMVRGGAGGIESDAALKLLVETMASSEGEEVKPLGQQWKDDVRRATMYGLSACGARAVPSLVQLLADPSVTVRVAATHALSEATTTPTVDLVDTLISLLEPTAAAIEAAATTENNQQTTDLKLLHATVLQSLGFIGTRASGLGMDDLVAKIVAEAALPCMAAEEPGKKPENNSSRLQTRQNAALTMLMLCTKIKDAALLDAAVDAMAACTNDEDRYVTGYCYEAIRQVSEQELAAGGEVDITAVAQQQLLNKVTYERWCPQTGAGVSSF